MSQLSPSMVALLAGVADVVAADFGVADAVGLGAAWYDHEEDGACVDVTVTKRCGCQHTTTRCLDRGTLRPHGVVRCSKHTPVVVDRTTRWPEEIPF